MRSISTIETDWKIYIVENTSRTEDGHLDPSSSKALLFELLATGRSYHLKKKLNDTKKTTFKKNKKLSSEKIHAEVLRFFKKHPKKKLNAKTLSRKIKVANKDAVHHAMVSLSQAGSLSSFKNGLFGFARNRPKRPGAITEVFTGKVDLTRTGAAFIITEESAQDIYVPAKFVSGAINGDTVDVTVHDFRKGRRPEREEL